MTRSCYKLLYCYIIVIRIVRELLLLTDTALVLSNNVGFSFDDFEQLVKVVCTCRFALL